MDTHQQESSIKLKRCKHGRIIIKDLSKKKPVQESTRSSPTQPMPTIEPSNSKFTSPKTAHINPSPLGEPSPVRSPARSPATPSIDSGSSDIYDPEEPIIPLSPCDSPPLSPLLDNDEYEKPPMHRPSGKKNGDDDVPSSAVQLNTQMRYLQKLNRQERVIEEVKIALRPHYQCRSLGKEQYKDVLRRAVPKICHSKNGEINPTKIRALVDAYVKKLIKHSGA